jgi:D-alanine-D-alanine ligase
MSVLKGFENKNIGVFFGGISPEHDISIITGEFVISALQKEGYRVVPVYVSKNGSFFLDNEISELKFFKDNYINKLSKLKEYNLNINKSKNKLVFENKTIFSNTEKVIDFVIPTFHGINGEDGSIQGLCQFFGIDYAGCGVFTSSLCINKNLTKNLLIQKNIPTPDFVSTKEIDYIKNKDRILNEVSNKLKYPVFVKPTKAGSSIGISKVDEEENLLDAIDLAFSYDDEVLIENGIENMQDLTCCVLSDGKKIEVSEIQESKFTNGFLNYEDKYLKDGGTQTGNSEKSLEIPAKVTKDQEIKIKAYAKKVFKYIDANGIARVDFLINKKSEEIFITEVNTLPGTLYNHLWEYSNIKIKNIIEYLLKHGSIRSQIKNKSDLFFQSDILNGANNMKLKS